MLAPSPSQSARPIPYGLVSLWDMINFSLYSFVQTITVIAHLHVRAAKSNQHAVLSPDDREFFMDQVGHVAAELRGLHLDAAGKRLGRLLTDLRTSDRLTYHAMADHLTVLHQAIVDDVETERFYHYPRDKGLMVLTIQGDWAATAQSFKKAMPDVEAGVDCLALGHATASVFHMMRVAEFGIRGLARELGVALPAKTGPLEWQDWNTLIEQIASRYKALRDAAPKGPKRDAIADFYSGAVGEMSAFKDEFRNHVMHTRKTYNERAAEGVMIHVRSFMERLSAKTNENGRKIRWS